MIDFGVSFDGFSSIREMVETARVAEEGGARSFWLAEHLGYRESFIAALAVAQGVRSAWVAPTAVSPYLRHPMPTAMALASMAELLPGRVSIAIGTGNPMFLKESGLAIEKPVKAVRDYVAALRGLLSGEPVTQEGQTFRLENARLAFTPQTQPNIYLAPMGPQMLRLSGAVGDGFVLSAGLAAAHVKESIATVAEAARGAGRDPGKLHKAAYIYFMAGGDLQAGNLKTRRKLAFLFRNENIAANIKSSGVDIDQEAIMAAIANRDHDGATRLVPPEAVDVFAVAGDIENCRRRLRAYADAGIEHFVLSLVGDEDDRRRSLSLIKEL